MPEETKTNAVKSQFSFGLTEQFKEETDQKVKEMGQAVSSLNPLPITVPKTDEEIRLQAIHEAMKDQIPFDRYEFTSKLTKKGETSAKIQFKNPLSIKVGDGVEVEPIVKPTLEDGKPAVKELGGKVKFDWHKLEVEGKVELKKGEIEKVGVTISGKF